MSEEQRRHPRYAVEVAAEVEIGGEMVVAATNNISSGGASIIVDRSIEEGAEIGVTLFLTQDGIEDPDEEPFEARAQVMWAAEQDEGRWVAGLRFGNLHGAQAARLDRFLKAVS